jgi:hypothetical protein
MRTLMGLLELEREAIYRRLRKDVAFSIHEIVKIASAWNISLDKVVGINSGKIPFLMQRINYIDPSEQELKTLRQIIQKIKNMKNFPEAEYMFVLNKLPRQLLAGYKYLNQFYLFKWNYQYGENKEVIPFSQIMVSEEKVKLDAEYYNAVKQVPTSNFIWDRQLFDYLVDDVRYFCSIQLINNEEKQLIKNDLYNLLDYMLEVAGKGYYPETKQKVYMYVSQLNVDTNYSYIYTSEFHTCFIHAFEKHELHTYNSDMVENFRTWMQAKKRTSTQISEVDERSRVAFFAQQRQYVDEL